MTPITDVELAKLKRLYAKAAAKHFDSREVTGDEIARDAALRSSFPALVARLDAAEVLLAEVVETWNKVEPKHRSLLYLMRVLMNRIEAHLALKGPKP